MTLVVMESLSLDSRLKWGYLTSFIKVSKQLANIFKAMVDNEVQQSKDLELYRYPSKKPAVFQRSAATIFPPEILD